MFRSEDEGLMLRVQDGDEAALELLLERYGAMVLSIGLRILRDTGEAQELVQDVFLQLYQKRHLYNPEKGTLRAWLLQSAYHRACDRREYLTMHRFYDGRNLDKLVEALKASADVEYEAQIRERQAMLQVAFQELTVKQQMTLQLFFFEGYTLREISQQLNESLINVRHHYYRGLERLRSSLEVNALNDR